ncbi:uncharacterized protein CDV56_103483 [Aspergillus thermomutatus]|uniref:Uncharacterized protein n=1 Tax=Aspergillus thermomutatus TaxID=41047 RepID=A0A397GI75_ASPTH|nr:uncharacterized protein CDV56_103483 [Aspergillus thermomutatus]RHZ50662.1 hypothetical protein CDV56_103483 [Aspergillus thermomutatus]
MQLTGRIQSTSDGRDILITAVEFTAYFLHLGSKRSKSSLSRLAPALLNLSTIFQEARCTLHHIQLVYTLLKAREVLQSSRREIINWILEVLYLGLEGGAFLAQKRVLPRGFIERTGGLDRWYSMSTQVWIVQFVLGLAGRWIWKEEKPSNAEEGKAE